MELSIIVTNYKNPELLRECLNSIKKNCVLKDYEIIVADSETEEDTKLMMKENFSEIKFLSFESNVGFGYLVRSAYEKSSGKYVLVLNGDMIVKEGSIEKLLEYIKSHQEVGIVGPQLLNFNGTLQQSCFRFYRPMTIVYRRTFLGKFEFAKKHLDNFTMADFDHKSTREVDWLMGSALMTSRPVVEKVGLLDERYKMYLEDTDWCRSFWEKGYKVVYYPESQMYHYHGRGSAGKSIVKTLLFNRLTWMHITSAVKYFWKFKGKSIPKHN